jgi:integrase
MVEFYLKHVRPVIAERVGADPDNPYLFPARGKGHRAPESLNKQFVERNWKVGGFRLNLHCQRHLAAKIILDRDHEAWVTVRDLLGHKSTKTTERYYAEINEIFAQREYHAHLEQHYAELVARRNRTGLRRKS